MPSPGDNESRDEFMERCMADEEARRDFPDESQRFAFCASQWRRSRNQRSNEGSGMEVKAVPAEVKVDADQRIVEGYAATFSRDAVDDIIEPGAFAKTISERGDRVKVLWQHMSALGTPLHMEEDSTGLFTRSRISKTTLGDDALTLMADGVVDQMSIGFSIPQGKAEFESDGVTRRIKEVKLFEYSAVTFPANEDAVITGVKQLYDHARKHGTDAFGDKASDLHQTVQKLEALLSGQEPPAHHPEGGGVGTSAGNQSPDDSRANPQEADIKDALQSLADKVQGWAIETATTRFRG